MAAASASTSPSGTTCPSTPSRMMSRGPVGQSKLTTGSPTAIASSSTIGKPSLRELITYSEARDISSCRLDVKPIICALSSIPRRRIWRRSGFMSTPLPKIFSCQPGWSPITRAHDPQQAVEALLATEAAGRDHDLLVERRPVAADVRHAVRHALDARAAAEVAPVGLGVPLGERRHHVQARVDRHDLVAQRVVVAREIHVVLPDADHGRRGEQRDREIDRRARADQHAVAHREDVPSQPHVRQQVEVRIPEVVRRHQSRRLLGQPALLRAGGRAATSLRRSARNFSVTPSGTGSAVSARRRYTLMISTSSPSSRELARGRERRPDRAADGERVHEEEADLHLRAGRLARGPHCPGERQRRH